MPLNFENGLTIGSLVDSRAYVDAKSQPEMDRIKKQAPANTFKNDDPPNFRMQVENGQLEKPLATVTLKFGIEDPNSA